MKKIIVPFDGDHYSAGVYSFANGLNNITPVLLTGIFLAEADYARYIFFPTAFSAPVFVPHLQAFEEEDINNNVEHFSKFCKDNFIAYKVHKDMYDSAIPVLNKETRFADLMLIGSETFYKNGIAYGSNQYLKEALHKTECPVVIVPEKFEFPNRVILAYDGSASSVFAIRQFTYLFPELCDKKAILIYTGDDEDEIPDQLLIDELVSRHFRDVSTIKISGDDSKHFEHWLDKQPNPLLVCGSFGRSVVSELFNQSFVMDIIKKYKTPVFIAHH